MAPIFVSLVGSICNVSDRLACNVIRSLLESAELLPPGHELEDLEENIEPTQYHDAQPQMEETDCLEKDRNIKPKDDGAEDIFNQAPVTQIVRLAPGPPATPGQVGGGNQQQQSPARVDVPIDAIAVEQPISL